ncbi:MAG: hypothetical protein NT157_06390 [Candidatus Micrarchaeota archaeon]|nr:hypothetical protein [Candidatus Micrarchaeota archaeon]
MVEISTRYYAYGCFVAGAFTIFIAMTTAGWLFAIIAAFFFSLSLATYKYGYLLVPVFTKFARIVEIHDRFEIPPGQQAILKQVGNSYYASVFLYVRIYDSVTDKTVDETQSYVEYFERAISSVKYVTKFAMMVYMKDLIKYREKIETKRAEAQLRLSREREKSEPDVLRIDRYEREISMWDSQLSRIASGVKPMGALCYVMTTASGVSKEAAVAQALNQANELRATISNALNTDVVIVDGEDMKRCFEWEYILPPTSKEFEDSIV